MHDTKKNITFRIEVSRDEADDFLVASSRAGGEYGVESIAIEISLRYTNDNMGFVDRFKVDFDCQCGVEIVLRHNQDLALGNRDGLFFFDFRANAEVLKNLGADIDEDFFAIVRSPSALPDLNWPPRKLWNFDGSSFQVTEESRSNWEHAYRHAAGVVPLFRELLDGMISIGPHREIPKANYAPRRHPNVGRWRNGLAAWDLLHWEPESPPRTERSLQRVSERFFKKCLSGNVLRFRGWFGGAV